MSREIPLFPEPEEKRPHWTDRWQTFHDNGEIIFNMPTDAWEVVAREDESDVKTFHEVVSMVGDFLGRPGEVDDERLELYRRKVDELVDAGPKTLGAAVDTLRKIYSELLPTEDEDLLLDIIKLLFLSQMRNRIHRDLFEKLRQDEAYQEEIRKSLEEDQAFQFKDDDFAWDLALATAIKMGFDSFREPIWAG